MICIYSAPDQSPVVTTWWSVS